MFNGTGNSAQLCQNFGISGGGGFEHPPPRYATANSRAAAFLTLPAAHVAIRYQHTDWTGPKAPCNTAVLLHTNITTCFGLIIQFQGHVPVTSSYKFENPDCNPARTQTGLLCCSPATPILMLKNSLRTRWYQSFHVSNPSASIRHWDLLMTSTLKFLNLLMTKYTEIFKFAND
jgi:hypothetical protein